LKTIVSEGHEEKGGEDGRGGEGRRGGGEEVRRKVRR